MILGQLLRDLFDSWKSYVDTANIMVVLAVLTDVLPAITAVLSFIWVCIRIYETETVQKLLHPKPLALPAPEKVPLAVLEEKVKEHDPRVSS